MTSGPLSYDDATEPREAFNERVIRDVLESLVRRVEGVAVRAVERAGLPHTHLGTRRTRRRCEIFPNGPCCNRFCLTFTSRHTIFWLQGLSLFVVGRVYCISCPSLPPSSDI
jgi:hypothetical protein